MRASHISSTVTPKRGKLSAFTTAKSHESQHSTGQGNARDTSLDFVKGTLVLLMVLYHWLNYFGADYKFDFRYIRFITPSFVFLAGFLVTNLLVTRPGQNSSSLALRLFIRGVKLLALFTVLNIGVAWLAPLRPSGRALGLTEFFETMPGCYLNGHNTVFFVLMPISYTLIIAALILKVCDLSRLQVLVPAVAVFAVGSVAILLGRRSDMLELIGSGLLGLMFGAALAQRLQNLRRLWPWLMIAFVLEVTALIVWGVPYLLQLVTVCVNLGLLYCLANWVRPGSAIARLTLLLGQYTLFGYVGQIAILQLLAVGFRLLDLGSAGPPAALIAALLLTITAIAAMDLLRRKLHAVDLLYRFVFA